MKRKLLYILFLIPVFTSCLESPEMTTGIVNGKEKPTVITGKIELHSCLDGRLFFQGEITSMGKAEITERGFYWDTVFIDDGKGKRILSDANTDSFSCELRNASGDKTYYWRAFAKNKHGEEFGEIRSIQAPKIWDAKKSLGANGRGSGAVVAHNNKIYIVCGEFVPGGPLNEVWKYDIVNNDWFYPNTFIGGNRRYPVAFTIGNKLYAGTGQRANQVEFNDLFRYEEDDDKWTVITTPDDFLARYDAKAFSLNGKGYIVGGRSDITGVGGFFNDVWQYSPETDFWEKKGDFPVKFYGGICITGNNRVFVGFNYYSEDPKVLWEYDNKTDKWNYFTELPDNVGKIFSGAIVQDSIYIVDEKNIIWVCDMNNLTKTWKSKTNLPTEFLNNYGEGGNQNLIASGNSIYVGLGFTRSFYEYRPLWDN